MFSGAGRPRAEQTARWGLARVRTSRSRGRVAVRVLGVDVAAADSSSSATATGNPGRVVQRRLPSWSKMAMSAPASHELLGPVKVAEQRRVVQRHATRHVCGRPVLDQSHAFPIGDGAPMLNRVSPGILLAGRAVRSAGSVAPWQERHPLAGLNDAQRRRPKPRGAPSRSSPAPAPARRRRSRTGSRTRCAPGAFEPRADPRRHVHREGGVGELKARLARLGVDGVEARTFHASALRQLGALWPRFTGQRPARDPERQGADPEPDRERAAGRRTGSCRAASSRARSSGRRTGSSTPPATSRRSRPRAARRRCRADLMQRTFQAYERTKGDRRMDFEDMLWMLVRLFDDEPEAAGLVRERFHAFTVDEYQDVNPLQQALLDRWLGGRDELCVVGDDYQTIYTFTGASPEYLLSFPDRYPERDGRAARGELPLVAAGADRRQRARPHRWAGSTRRCARRAATARARRRGRCPTPTPRSRSSSAEAQRLHGERRAVGADRRALPHQRPLRAVRGGARRRPVCPTRCATARSCGARAPRGDRPAPPGRRRRRRGRGGDRGDRRARVRADGAGDDAGEDEVTRQADLARLRALAAEYAAAAGERATSPGSWPSCEQRFAAEREGRGVQLMTYHRAKGLEFDAVFLPRLLDGELPFRARRERGRSRRGTAPALRGHHPGARAPVPVVAARAAHGAEPVPRRDRRGEARGRSPGAPDRARPASPVTVGAGGAAVRPVEGVAPQACLHRRRARVRRVPRRDARRDRRAQAARLGGPRVGARASAPPSSTATPTRCSRSSSQVRQLNRRPATASTTRRARDEQREGEQGHGDRQQPERALGRRAEHRRVDRLVSPSSVTSRPCTSTTRRRSSRTGRREHPLRGAQ